MVRMRMAAPNVLQGLCVYHGLLVKLRRCEFALELCYVLSSRSDFAVLYVIVIIRYYLLRGRCNRRSARCPAIPLTSIDDGT